MREQAALIKGQKWFTPVCFGGHLYHLACHRIDKVNHINIFDSKKTRNATQFRAILTGRWNRSSLQRGQISTKWKLLQILLLKISTERRLPSFFPILRKGRRERRVFDSLSWWRLEEESNKHELVTSPSQFIVQLHWRTRRYVPGSTKPHLVALRDIIPQWYHKN